jgi:hypothetical protein
MVDSLYFDKLESEGGTLIGGRAFFGNFLYNLNNCVLRLRGRERSKLLQY